MIGILVVVNAISVKRAGKYIATGILLLLLGPVFYNIIKKEFFGFTSASHPWWAYVAAILVVAVVIRVVVRSLFSRRRH